jgi:hypothetical protein
MTGKEYANLVANYIAQRYRSHGLKVYQEVRLGKSIIGKNRHLDILVVSQDQKLVFAIECKYQAGQGTADEKIPYALADIESMWIPGCVAYAGEGFSEGILQMLRSHRHAAYCLPDSQNFESGSNTVEIDQILASIFGFWDVIIGNKKPL